MHYKNLTHLWSLKTTINDSGNSLTLTKNKKVATCNPKNIILNEAPCLDLCFMLELNIWNPSDEIRMRLRELRSCVNSKPFNDNAFPLASAYYGELEKLKFTSSVYSNNKVVFIRALLSRCKWHHPYFTQLVHICEINSQSYRSCLRNSKNSCFNYFIKFLQKGPIQSWTDFWLDFSSSECKFSKNELRQHFLELCTIFVRSPIE